MCGYCMSGHKRLLSAVMTTEPMLAYVLRRLSECKGEHKRIARATGVPYSTLTKIVQGTTENPGVRHVQALHDYLRGTEKREAEAA